MADLLFREAEHFGHFPYGGPCAKGIVIGHHSGPLVSVFCKKIVDDPFPFVPGKIDINIRRVHAVKIQKSFKKKIVFYWVHMGDTQSIGNNRRGSAPPATRPMGISCDIRHHQKIMGKFLLSDDPHLMIHPILYRLSNLPISSSAPIHGDPIKAIKSLLIIHAIKSREYDAGKIPVFQALIRHLTGI